MILGLDVSHHQTVSSWPQVKSSRDFVALKATEGIGYTDPSFAANRKAAHGVGLIVGIYHYASGGNPANEAAYFLGVIGQLQPGEFLVLDWECTYAGDHVAWCKAWLDAVRAATGVAPLIYMNQTVMNGHNWMPISSTYGLWLARYDGLTAAPGTCNCWPAAAMKQYSSAGTVPGIVGTCDVNAFYGTPAQLLAYGHQGDIMATLDAEDLVNIYKAVWTGAPGAPLLSVEQWNSGEWPATTLGSMLARIKRDIISPQLAELAKTSQAAGSQPVTVDAAAVAAALAGNSTFLTALAKAVNDDAARRLAS